MNRKEEIITESVCYCRRKNVHITL